MDINIKTISIRPLSGCTFKWTGELVLNEPPRENPLFKFSDKNEKYQPLCIISSEKPKHLLVTAPIHLTLNDVDPPAIHFESGKYTPLNHQEGSGVQALSNYCNLTIPASSSAQVACQSSTPNLQSISAHLPTSTCNASTVNPASTVYLQYIPNPSIPTFTTVPITSSPIPSLQVAQVLSIVPQQQMAGSQFIHLVNCGTGEEQLLTVAPGMEQSVSTVSSNDVSVGLRKRQRKVTLEPRKLSPETSIASFHDYSNSIPENKEEGNKKTDTNEVTTSSKCSSTSPSHQANENFVKNCKTISKSTSKVHVGPVYDSARRRILKKLGKPMKSKQHSETNYSVRKKVIELAIKNNEAGRIPSRQKVKVDYTEFSDYDSMDDTNDDPSVKQPNNRARKRTKLLPDDMICDKTPCANGINIPISIQGDRCLLSKKMDVLYEVEKQISQRPVINLIRIDSSKKNVCHFVRRQTNSINYLMNALKLFHFIHDFTSTKTESCHDSRTDDDASHFEISDKDAHESCTRNSLAHRISHGIAIRSNNHDVSRDNNSHDACKGNEDHGGVTISDDANDIFNGNCMDVALSAAAIRINCAATSNGIVPGAATTNGDISGVARNGVAKIGVIPSVAQDGVVPGVAVRSVIVHGVAQDGVVPGVAVKNVDLRGVAVKNVDLCCSAVKNVDVPGVAVKNVDVPGVAVKNVDVPGVAVKNVDLRGVAVKNVDVPGVAVRNVDVPGVAQDGVPGFALRNVNFPNVVQDGVPGVALRNVNFPNVAVKHVYVPGVVRDSGFPGILRDGGVPVVVRDSGIPGVVRDGDVPGVVRDGGIPGVVQDGGIPGDVQDGGIPGDVQDGGVPGVVQDGGVPRFVRNRSVPDFVRDSCFPGVVRDSGVPGVVRDSGVPGVVRDSGVPGVVRDSGVPGVVRDSGVPGVVRDSDVPGVVQGGAVPCVVRDGGIPGGDGEGRSKKHSFKGYRSDVEAAKICRNSIVNEYCYESSYSFYQNQVLMALKEMKALKVQVRLREIRTDSLDFNVPSSLRSLFI